MFHRLATLAVTLAACSLVTLVGCAGTQQAAKPAPKARPAAVSDGMNHVIVAYPTGDRATSVVLIDKAVPKEVRVNQPFSYKITVTSLVDHALHNVVVSDKLSENFKVSASSPSGTAGDGGRISWALGGLAAKASKTIRIDASAGGAGSIGSCAGISYDSLACATIPVVEPKLLIAMSGPTEALACDEIVYTLRVTNTGTAVVPNVKITNNLPAGLMTRDGKQLATADVGTLQPHQTRQFKIATKAAKTGVFANQATVAGAGVKASSNTVSTTVREPVLTIAMSGPSKKFIGRTTDYEITVTNTGDGEARDLSIENTLPAGSTFVRASDGGKPGGSKVRWEVESLAPKASKKVSVTIKATEAGKLRTAAKAKAYCADEVAAAATTTYEGIPAILLEVVDIEDPLEVGSNGTYVITATNQGSAPGTNIKIKCMLEGNVQYVSSSGSSKGTIEGNTVTFAPLANLPAGKDAVWKVILKGVEPGDVRFKVTMISDQLSRTVEETEATNLYK